MILSDFPIKGLSLSSLRTSPKLPCPQMADIELKPTVWQKATLSRLYTMLPLENITLGQDFTGLEGIMMESVGNLKEGLKQPSEIESNCNN